MDHRYLLERLIPYRLGAIEALGLALKYLQRSETPQAMEIYFAGQLVIQGNSYGFLNPVFESGLIHCRALLEFLGLRAQSSEKSLGNVRLPRRADDLGIEAFSNSQGPLPLVTPKQAVARYGGGAREAQDALLAVFHATNKGLAHVTRVLDLSRSEARLIEIAGRGVHSLVVSHLYTPLKLPPPPVIVTSRPRGGL